MVPNFPRPSTDVSRRTIITTTATFVAGGGVVAALGSQPAGAAVSTTSLEIPTAEAEGPGGKPSTVRADVAGNYEYSTNGADTVQLALDVASAIGADDWETIDTSQEPASAESGAGSYNLSGSVLDHPNMSAETFAAEPEQTREVEFPVRVVMDVLQGGETVVAALAEGVATVRVTNSDIVASAAVTGSGQIAVEV